MDETQTGRTQQDDFEPIDAQAARRAIEDAIHERLGDDWKKKGWMRVHNSDYLVRMHRDDINLDFHCDLLGNVEIIEREANPVQLSGRFLAWTVLLASLGVALMIAILSGAFA